MSSVHSVHQIGELLSIVFGNTMTPEILIWKKKNEICLDFFETVIYKLSKID